MMARALGLALLLFAMSSAAPGLERPAAASVHGLQGRRPHHHRRHHERRRGRHREHGHARGGSGEL
ncbi:MAG TPA: hypothetical protein VHO67_07320 [Polyangia bacterium]|nr:hypothetical protein [Polyangia bacterium]